MVGSTVQARPVRDSYPAELSLDQINNAIPTEAIEDESNLYLLELIKLKLRGLRDPMSTSVSPETRSSSLLPAAVTDTSFNSQLWCHFSFEVPFGFF